MGGSHFHFAHYHTAGVPILRALAATGYDGYVGHEFIPKGDPLAALEAAYRLCDV